MEYLDAAEQPGKSRNLAAERFRSGRELYIEREDFMEEPPKKYFRLFPGNEVRLMNAYFVTCTGCEKDENGNVTVIHATYDPETKGGNGTGRQKGKRNHSLGSCTALQSRQKCVCMRTSSMRKRVFTMRTVP